MLSGLAAGLSERSIARIQASHGRRSWHRQLGWMVRSSRRVFWSLLADGMAALKRHPSKDRVKVQQLGHQAKAIQGSRAGQSALGSR